MPEDKRTPRPQRLTERIWRVSGYEYPAAVHVTTWTYKRLADAEWRARHIQRLTNFSFADVEWKPMPLPPATTTTGAAGADESSGTREAHNP